MKRICALSLVLLLSGCLVQSLQPFYTDESKVKVPELKGEWKLVTDWGRDVSGTEIKPWVLGEDQVTTYNESNETAQIQMVYFKMGETLYCDSGAGDPGKTAKINEYWVWHFVSAHTLWKVELKEDVVRFLPMDLDWMKDAMQNGRILVPPHFDRDDKQEWPVFSATPGEWQDFLKSHGADPGVFSTNNVYVLKKLKPAAAPKEGAKP